MKTSRSTGQRRWARFDAIIIAIAVVIVIGTAGYNGYRYWSDLQASRSGDQFLAALNLARDGQTEAALTELEVIESDGHGAYPVLARLRAATILADSGALEEAVSSFNAIAADSTVPEVLRQTVAIRAGYLDGRLCLCGDVSSAVERFAVSGHAMRHGARNSGAVRLDERGYGKGETVDR